MYSYDARVIRVVDGDTVVLHLEKEFSLKVDFGFYIKDEVKLAKTAQLTFRLLGIDTPEVVGASKPEGLKAKAELERLLSIGPIRAETEKGDKYGRWLVRLFVKQPNGVELSVNDALLADGFAKPYMV
jgi:endonuclease YncB( thermonuclease family)